MTQDGTDKPGTPGEEKKPLVEYPSVYEYKVMGKATVEETPGFEEHVRSLFRRKLGSEVSPDSIHVQHSRKGKFVSLSVSVLLLSEEQRRAIYAELHQDPRIVYYL
ncbi:DUF493 domain-containing protein [Corallococcus sp. AB049A]|uniref:DUF493 domain-containing protein n=1 Tax=Corallococcus interemptor TaxID=2316720 RepID=A0A3A8QZQ4_9BACT|nr:MULTISPECIES: DUF493 domain-containing protein [Corallococcus]RKH43511.1 DUF493 domain-containing protein [Corallococcus sp. AB050B]RKH74057.1 DUF493 domain-containing protein [Corallococcus interemptor]RKI68738.1 DUF493 domain-containing protein [Corallococcus sp. AB049A]